MLPKSAIRDFMRRKRRDFRPYKTYNAKRLQREMLALPIRPPIWDRLQIDQKRCLIIGAKTGRFGFHLDTGMGKTLASLSVARYHMKLGKVKRVLVLVPTKLNKPEWKYEIEKHTAMDYVVLSGSSDEKWATLEENDAAVVIETYGGLVNMCSEIEQVKKKRSKKLVNKFKLVPRLVQKLHRMFDGLVLDESTMIAKKGTLFYRLCKAIGKGKPLFIELTGTPFGRDPTALWSQINLIDNGHTLGETLGLYRGAFFEEKAGNWTMFEYSFDDRKSKLLHDCLAHCTINITADESSLPDVTRDIVRVKMPVETRMHFDNAYQAFRLAYQRTGDQKERMNTFVRMRQLSSGFMGFKDELGKDITVFKNNPKLDAIVDYIKRIPLSEKIIVFHDFNPSGEIIAKRFKAEGIGFTRLWSGTKDTDAARDAFENDDTCQCLVMSMAGAYGLNLQIARYGLYFESPVPVILRKQSERRFIRQHSRVKKKFLVDFVTDYTMDDRILEFHKQGGDLYSAIVQGRDIEAPAKRARRAA